jgi:hypothetical protein
MSRRVAIRCLLPALVLALLLAPATAAAGPFGFPFHLPAGIPPQLRTLVGARIDPGRSPASENPRFNLKTPNGYLVEVIGRGRDVAIETARPHGKAFTAYITRGTVTAGRLEASFGQLGKVAMRFQPARHGNPIKPRRRCHGRGQITNRRGVYVGSFRFKGENGYVAIDAHRAKGELESVPPSCEGRRLAGSSQRAIRPPQGGHEGPLPKILAASWRHAVNSAAFIAIGGFERTQFLALASQSEGRLAILHFAFASGPAKEFAIDNALTAAQVSPPAPFSGTGSYSAAPDGTTTWAGPLTVNFPGASKFPLSGPPFKAVVEAGF